MEATKVPITRHMDKDVVCIYTHTYIYIIYIHNVHIYICNEILLSHKKNEILPSAAMWVDLENIMLSEKGQKKTSTLGCHLYVDIKNKTNEYIGKTDLQI